ncbi:MAG TPA: hypothetical protein VFA74_05190 [Terriglobales bacterium]|nr:hypothetical protein [Terriglobales bacterium]
MNQTPTHACTICGAERMAEADWFLITESRWEDRVKVLGWNDQLAMKPSIHTACSPNHVRELVVHWMTTGSLDYPFATVVVPFPESVQGHKLLQQRNDIVMANVHQIGELAVHRESLHRVLNDNPQSLNVILDELLYAVRREWKNGTVNYEEENRMVCVPTRAV